MKGTLPLLLLLLALVAGVQATSHHVHSSVPSSRSSPFSLLSVESRLGERLRVSHQLSTDSKDCILCTAAVSLLEQFALSHNLPLSAAAKQWCTYATVDIPLVTGICQLLLDPVVKQIEADFQAGLSPDVTCRTTFDSCSGVSEQCKLYPDVWPPPFLKQKQRVGVDRKASLLQQQVQMAEAMGKLLNVHALSEEQLQQRIRDLSQAGLLQPDLYASLAKGEQWLPVPVSDEDQDRYADKFTLRGSQWTGADCDDKDEKVYPGRNVFEGDFDKKKDANCNGISGVDSKSNIPWEAALCEPFKPRGLLAIGDSATAHFSLPPSYLFPPGFNASTYAGLINTLVSEADIPQCSWSTGWASNDLCPSSRLNMSSIYTRMRERNRCMHRDFVNLGVNGASVKNLVQDGIVTPETYEGNMRAIPKRFKTDGPSTVFFSLIGNDICNRKGPDSDYTGLDEFRRKVQYEFEYLDTVLAPNSHVIIMGLVDGRVLYNTLHDKMHPAGMTYKAFYDYLNCLGMSPCWGWMNSNQTIRDQSSFRAQQFNEIYVDIINNRQFNNFKLHFFWPDYGSIIQQWEAAGYSGAELIEQTDGFHPSTTGNILIAHRMWEFMEKNVPEAMGVQNPNNFFIQQQFGDQGGYAN